ncbi:Detected protein of confused Function [Hibiscus syriacus]|uniref:Transmembrane 9 superfamily member n=1 Tax=Hibiscus syriacus TaxID=106335 RepID=A0A6A3CZI5_HIBSY|nr:Detected protein of confused Function [Hibiscus syriacus]
MMSQNLEMLWTLEDKSPKYFLFKHVEFDVLYNGNHVIEVHAIGDPNRVVDITEDAGIDVDFTYSVTWNTTSAAFDTRMDRYSRASSLPFHQKIHWRRLKNDLRTFSTGDDKEEDKEVGWKYIHGSILNVVAVSYGETAALPFGTIMVIILIYTFLTIPLLVLGGVIGYRFRSEFQSPCATKRYPREVPPLAWYRKTPCQMFLGAICGRSSMVVEICAVWGINLYFHVCLWYLLLRKIKHEWLIAIFIRCRLQCLHVLCILLDAWHSRLPFFLDVRSLHLTSC